MRTSRSWGERLRVAGGQGEAGGLHPWLRRHAVFGTGLQPHLRRERHASRLGRRSGHLQRASSCIRTCARVPPETMEGNVCEQFRRDQHPQHECVVHASDCCRMPETQYCVMFCLLVCEISECTQTVISTKNAGESASLIAAPQQLAPDIASFARTVCPSLPVPGCLE